MIINDFLTAFSQILHQALRNFLLDGIFKDYKVILKEKNIEGKEQKL